MERATDALSSGQPPTTAPGTPTNIMALHRSRRASVMLGARVVLLPLSVSILAHNLTIAGDWTLQTWIVSVVLGIYLVTGSVELVRSLGRTELAVFDGDLVIHAPTLLRAAVRIPRDAVTDAVVTPKGWFGYPGTLPYSEGNTAGVTAERPDLGSNIKAAITLDGPVALPWRRIPNFRGSDLCRGRSMPRHATRLVLAASNRDLAQLHALIGAFMGSPPGTPAVARTDRARDVTVARKRILVALVLFAAMLALPKTHHDPLAALHPGVCLDAPTAATFRDVQIESCAVPHTAEVIGYTHNAQLATFGSRDCTTEFVLYAGTNPNREGVRIKVLRHHDSNDGVCIAVTVLPMTHSIHASGAGGAA